MDELHDWLELSLVPGIGPKYFFKLVDHFGSARSVLDAPESALRAVPDLNSSVIQSLKADRKKQVEHALELIDRQNISVVFYHDPLYPKRLRQIPDPPPLLYVKGTLLPADLNAISIVGTRRATHYGKTAAAKLAGDLARLGVTVVSGLAYGIDAAAHKGALEAGGRTFAVLGCGVDVIYPRANEKLYEQIVSSGAIVSEFPVGTQPDPGFFPMRNRIVSGISLGTLVVEAPAKSGALITSRFAMEHGREVFAVPGSIFSPYNEGCHKLIKDGAKLVENVYDIISEIERNIEGTAPAESAPQQTDAPREIPLTPDEKKVFNFLSMVPTHIDAIGEECGLTASQTAASLMMLEIKGLVQQLSGKMFIRRT
jgi:DNA processing protein